MPAWRLWADSKWLEFAATFTIPATDEFVAPRSVFDAFEVSFKTGPPLLEIKSKLFGPDGGKEGLLERGT